MKIGHICLPPPLMARYNFHPIMIRVNACFILTLLSIFTKRKDEILVTFQTDVHTGSGSDQILKNKSGFDLISKPDPHRYNQSNC